MVRFIRRSNHDHHDLRQRDCDGAACNLLPVTIRKIRILTTALSALSILAMTSAILVVPHVHSLSMNTPQHSTTSTFSKYLRTNSSAKPSTSLFLSTSSPTKGGRPRRYNKSNRNPNPNPTSTSTVESRWQRAIRIEQRTQFALEDLQQRINNLKDRGVQSNSDQKLSPTGKNTVIIRRGKSGVLSSVPSATTSGSTKQSVVAFPDIRECNSALAAFGDGGDLLRALRLYFKMRKATQLALAVLSSSSKVSEETPLVPTPTLVTFSTLMSRAVSLGKPQVALRIWKVMRDQTDFFSYSSAGSTLDNNTKASNSPTIKASELKNLIVPDVKSANILMNTYAKLGDIDAAEDLMKQMQTKPVLPQQDQCQTSAHNVVFGGGIDVPYLKPNLVTYNSLLDACQKTGEIDKALYWKSVLERQSNETKGGRNRATITYRNGKTRSIRLRPDARTYTILIGTVANKSSSSYSYGTHDPSLAFQLLEEMKSKHRIAPNPLTYSALIDVCGRCKRSDLALKALRLMLRDERMFKQMEYYAKKNIHKSISDTVSSASMQQQTVGAWTAAINACGKTGRIDTALKLFFVSMPRFKVKPNVITCSCLLDSLLKNGKTADSLEVLRYMKTNNLSPSEYMYTSFMNYAGRLAGLEQNNQRYDRGNGRGEKNIDDRTSVTNRPWPSLSDSNNATDTSYDDHEESAISDGSEGGDVTKAVDVYSELMSTLITTTARTTERRSPQSRKGPSQPPTQNSTHLPATTKRTRVTNNNELYQVTLVFREMKASGVTPDLGSYNTLLRSCSNSGDIDRAQEFLQEILEASNDLEPNDRTWRAVLRTAGKAKRSDIVLQTWKAAVADMGGDSEEKGSLTKKAAGKPVPSSTKKQKKRKGKYLSLQTFRALLMALLICAWDLRESDRHTSIELYKIIIKCYNALQSRRSAFQSSNGEEDESELYMGMHLVDSRAAMENPQVLASVLQAVVNLEYLLDGDDAWKDKLKQLGASIAGAKCLRNKGGGQNESASSKLSYFDKRALKTVRRWYSK